MTSKDRCGTGHILWHRLKQNSAFKMTLNEPKTGQINFVLICLYGRIRLNAIVLDLFIVSTFVLKHSVTNYTSVMMHTQSVRARKHTATDQPLFSSIDRWSGRAIEVR